MNAKVLIIEDEREMARLMGWGLAQSNFETRLAYDGVEGLTAIKESEPDIILTDIVMPQMDGYSLCRKLQEDGTLSRIPVVVLTAFAQRAEDFKSLDIQEFLVKPFATPQLVEVIERVLNKHRQAKKGKTIIVPNHNDPGITAALQQFRSMGYDAQIETLPEANFMEEVLRTQPAVLVVDAAKPGAAQLIRSLHSYVHLKDMVILFFVKKEESEKDKKPSWGWFGSKNKEDKALEEIKKSCLEAGATKYLESLDREKFLAALIEYCR